MRVVLDTNVLVAALRSELGASRQILLAALDRRFTLLGSTPLLLEYEAVLTREKHLAAAEIGREDVIVLLDAIAAVTEPVSFFFTWRPQLTDPSDEMVLATAVNGMADVIVSINSRDYQNVETTFGIPVQQPGDFWQAIYRKEGKGDEEK